MDVRNSLIRSLGISKYLTRSRWLRINEVQLYYIYAKFRKPFMDKLFLCVQYLFREHHLVWLVLVWGQSYRCQGHTNFLKNLVYNAITCGACEICGMPVASRFIATINMFRMFSPIYQHLTPFPNKKSGIRLRLMYFICASLYCFLFNWIKIFRSGFSWCDIVFLWVYHSL